MLGRRFAWRLHSFCAVVRLMSPLTPLVAACAASNSLPCSITRRCTRRALLVQRQLEDKARRLDGASAAQQETQAALQAALEARDAAAARLQSTEDMMASSDSQLESLTTVRRLRATSSWSHVWVGGGLQAGRFLWHADAFSCPHTAI